MNAIGTQLHDQINLGLTRWRIAVLINKRMEAAAELGRNPVGKYQIQPEYGDEQADAGRDCRTPSRETKFSGANADREIFIFPCSADHVQDWQCRLEVGVSKPPLYCTGFSTDVICFRSLKAAMLSESSKCALRSECSTS